MSPVTTCPDRDVLIQLLLGRIAAPEAEQLARHLEECDRCAAVVKTLPAEDTLVEAARSRPTEVAAPTDPTLRNLVERLRQQGPPPADVTHDTQLCSPSMTDIRALTAITERYDFLSLPQGPGEMGRLGTYRVLRVLGVGGMGVVFQAEDVTLKRQVALKVMKPEAAAKSGARERFLREARAAASLEHDHIVAIYQVSEENRVPYLAMQWLKGMSLEERLQQTGALDTAAVLRLGRQIARGLAAAHSHGLIHRDIKPANIWLEPDPDQGERVKILDFGLARDLSDEAHLTQSGMILGTPAYMAPEQARSEKLDARCDLFSLGVVLYRMGTGQLPFRGDNTMAMLTSLAVDTPAQPRNVNPSLPPGLCELVMQLLSKDPANRPASAQVVAERLQALERQLAAPIADDATEALPPRPRTTRRRPLLVAAVALLVLLPLGYFFGGTIFRIATNRGELIIDSDDPNIEVTIKGPSATVYDKVKDRRFVLTAGDYEVEVREQGDGGVRFATKKFTITRGGKETFEARLEAVKTKPPAVGGEREAAEWVLSLGGNVRTVADNKNLTVTAAKDLPAVPFQVVSVGLQDNKQLTDAGLEHLKTLTNLTDLSLNGTNVGDTGLVNFKTLTNLTVLRLDGTPVSDAGLVHFRTLSKLTTLNLYHTKVTDAGLEHLKPLTNLTGLHLKGTKVTAAGVAALRKTLPKCRIISDFSAVGNEGNAAEWVLSLGGTVKIRAAGKEEDIAAAGSLPAGPFQVIQVDFRGNKQLTDAGLENLKTLTNLDTLVLASTKVSGAGLEYLKTLSNLENLNMDATSMSDAGLAHLTPLTKLRTLYLAGTKVSDAGLAHLKTFANLQQINLNHTNVSDAGLAHLQNVTTLSFLFLNGTRVTDDGLKHLKTLTNLKSFTLADTNVTDAGLEHLKALTRLLVVDLTSTRVTAAGIAALRKALPQCRVLPEPGMK